jgi:hypothetical protein
MARPLPPDFTVQAQQLDPYESYIRDQLALNITNWARFRYVINVGTNSDNLLGRATVAKEVKESYCELGKSHYEVITSLGNARLAWYKTACHIANQSVLFRMSAKEFYFHTGCLLDNLARLIYIINDPGSATATNRRGGLMRHWVDWGSLQSYAGYARLKRSTRLKGIINIRNTLTHSWSIPFASDPAGAPLWPLGIRTRRDHPWPSDSKSRLAHQYRRWIPVAQMMEADLRFVEPFQDTVFAKLTRGIVRFERAFNVQIQ